MAKPMNCSRRRSANVKGFLGKSPTTAKDRPQITKGVYSGRFFVPSLDSEWLDDEVAEKEEQRIPPTSPRSGVQSGTTSIQLPVVDEEQQIIRSSSSCSEESTGSNLSSLSGNESRTPAYASGMTFFPSGNHESSAVQELIDNLDDIDESYMLSVFWGGGDSDLPMKEFEGALDSSISSGLSKCSLASASSTSTSTTNYAWTTSRRRHHGAYKKRARTPKKAPKHSSWVDSMESSSAMHLGFAKSWTAGQGFETKCSAWDPKPDPSTWGYQVAGFDAHSSERLEI